MRKTFQTEAARIVTMIILLMSTVTKGLAQSPYALFGDNSKMLEATEESVPNSYGVLAKTANGATFYADFDLRLALPRCLIRIAMSSCHVSHLDS